jgi:hypothetical protein
MRCAGHATRVRVKGTHVGYLWKSQKLSDYKEEADVDGNIVLK